MMLQIHPISKKVKNHCARPNSRALQLKLSPAHALIIVPSPLKNGIQFKTRQMIARVVSKGTIEFAQVSFASPLI